MRKEHFYRAAGVLFFAGVLSILFLPSFAAAQTEQIRLAWDKNSETDIAGYRVYYDNVSGTAGRGYSYSVDVEKSENPTCTLTLDQGKTYYIAVTALDSSGNESGYSVELKRQSYNDAGAGYWAHEFVMAISDTGITAGCVQDDPATPENEASFCGDYPITRGQMAVFVEVSLGVVNPPGCAGNVFADVNEATVGAAICGFIEDFAARGITGGCGGNNFCPNAPVTRGQMAVFIEAALGNSPLQCTTQFGDVPASNPFCGYIEKLADDGITGGCGAGENFCPNSPVSRAEMAVFLVAAPDPLFP